MSMSSESPVLATDAPIADEVEKAVEDRPWITPLFRIGWLAKGAVYILMGLTTLTIGRQEPTADDASPEGVLAQIEGRPAGPVLLAVLGIGLVLYSVWRLISVVLVKGHDVRDWLDRIGFTASAAFYGVLAYTAIRSTIVRDQPEDSNTVEDLSKTMLESAAGRWVLLLAGAVAFTVGVYFVLEQGLRRSFLKDLHFEGASIVERRVVSWTGIVGWIGRGIVTSLVGFFVLRAAWQVDHDDARGFDRSLREVASTSLGMVVVFGVGVALIVYGMFCVASLRHRKLES